MLSLYTKANKNAQKPSGLTGRLFYAYFSAYAHRIDRIPLRGECCLKKICALMMILCMIAGMACSEEIDLSNTPAPEAEEEKCAYVPQISESPLMDVPPFHPECASVLLVEPESGQIIFEMNADTPFLSSLIGEMSA